MKQTQLLELHILISLLIIYTCEEAVTALKEQPWFPTCLFWVGGYIP